MSIRNTSWILLAMVMWTACGVAQAADDGVWGPYTPIGVKGNTLEMLKHRITLDPTGLPAQIYIKADPADLPLERRGEKVADAELVPLGRGPQLRTPLRLAATIAGQEHTAAATAPQRATSTGKGEVACTAQLKLGSLGVELVTRYDCDGAMVCRMTLNGNGSEVQSLELVMDLAGLVDTAYPGLPAGAQPGQIAFADLSAAVPAGDGVVWDSSVKGPNAPKSPFAPYLYFGSGDRGWTWLCDSEQGWELDPKAPALLLERDQAGQATFKARFITRPVKLSGKRTYEFALLTHPAQPRPKGIRTAEWLAFPAGQTVAPAQFDGRGQTTLAAREKLKALVRAAGGKTDNVLLGGLTAGALESLGSAIEMTGPACADILSAEKDGAGLYPISLFRALAAPRAVPVRVRPNVHQVVSAGDTPAVGRNFLGRALLHDAAVDLAGLELPDHFARVANELAEFGLFEDDETEVIPYWRTRGIVQYGEAFDAAGGFELTEENPYARVHTTVYRRPVRESGKVVGYKALIVVVNESDRPVRERLILPDPQRIFGGPNLLQGLDAAQHLDFTRIHALSKAVGWEYNDWDYSHLVGSWVKWKALQNLEDNGSVQENSAKGRAGEIYGPLFIRPHDFVLLYGYGRLP